jgi:hypothetical protein
MKEQIMREHIASGMAALMLATSLWASPAMAQPGRGDRSPPPHAYWEGRRDPPPGHEFRPPPSPDTRWDRRSGPPPGWDRDRWNYRRTWLRRHGHRDDDDNVAGLIMGAILGFALGAAVVDSQERQDYADSRLNDPGWIAYCARKYRSFDPYTGTYLGSDGLRHYCR